jgi:hypothetical protein
MHARTHDRNSRWDREPALSGGKPRIAALTGRDIEAFKLLARYRYLPLDDIHAFVGGSLKGLGHHFNVLSRKPNLYINRPHQQRIHPTSTTVGLGRRWRVIRRLALGARLANSTAEGQRSYLPGNPAGVRARRPAKLVDQRH